MSFEPLSGWIVNRDWGHLAHELEVSLRVAVEAGMKGLVFSKQHNEELEVVEKAGGDGPVSIADKTLNDYIIKELRSEFPDDIFVGEEGRGVEDMGMEEGVVGATRCWFIDPIDGTKEFLKRNGEWAVMIGLCEGFSSSSIPVLGVGFQPTEERVFFGVEKCGAFHCRLSDSPFQPERMIVNQDIDLKDATAFLSRSHDDPLVRGFCDEVGIKKHIVCGSFGIKAGLVACGTADLYINRSGRMHVWDTCAGDVFLREAGAEIYTFDGSHVDYSKTEDTQVRDKLVVAPKSLIPEILPLLVEYEKKQIDL
jgi:3'(2'), 5'-bisphosphate nucleotidase